ncbi:hypothetical protein RFI_00468, partial [Reticulomyxa filosa]
ALQNGDHLRGWFYLGNDDKLEPKFRRLGSQGLKSLGVAAVCTLADIKEEEKKNGGDKKEETEKLSLKEQERDILLRWIQKLSGKEQLQAFETTGDDLKKKFPDYLPLLQLQLQVYDKAKPRKDYLKQVVALADELIGQINTTEVAAFFGRKAVEKEDSEYKKLAKKCKEEKAMVIDALTRKAQALKEIITGEGRGGDPEQEQEQDQNQLGTDVEKTQSKSDKDTKLVGSLAATSASSSSLDSSFVSTVKPDSEIQTLPTI